MAHSPLESWKRRSPTDRDEAQAADLIKRVGDAEALSPQAMHRVAHRLRSPERRRLSLFSDIRLAAASVAVLLLFVVGAWATIGYFDHHTEMLAAPRRPVQQTLARNDVSSAPQPPEAAPPDGQRNGQGDGLRLEEPLPRNGKAERHQLLARELDDQARSGESGFAQAPSGWSPSDGASRSNALAAKKSESPMVAFVPPRTGAATEALNERQQASAADRRAAPAAPATAAPAEAAPPTESVTAGITAGMTAEGCKSTLGVDSETLANNAGDVERALFRRGVCLLLTGKQQAGTADLRTYLLRFPRGRFAEGVRALLVKNPAQTPTR